MIQITPQMRILVAVEAIDGRKGIDALAQLCREKLKEDPFSGCLFVFWPMTAKGSGLHRSGFPKGVFGGGRPICAGTTGLKGGQSPQGFVVRIPACKP